ncbi:antitoxin [Micropruina sonneratiae]|uniref:antitoxin n=1 Tax=Micropruina sonneratiae TaxID=2986940 RepID=UPI0022272E5B|nr:antitoxin [Micropruina sp. KQZ13P-5]MCW3157873.1 antitoxin [Micropruina sp. KQZ13P-5]
MGFVDKIKGAVSGHEDQIDGAIDQAGDFVDSKTDSKHAAQVDQAQDFLKGQVRQGSGTPEQPQT